MNIVSSSMPARLFLFFYYFLFLLSPTTKPLNQPKKNNAWTDRDRGRERRDRMAVCETLEAHALTHSADSLIKARLD